MSNADILINHTELYNSWLMTYLCLLLHGLCRFLQFKQECTPAWTQETYHVSSALLLSVPEGGGTPIQSWPCAGYYIQTRLTLSPLAGWGYPVRWMGIPSGIVNGRTPVKTLSSPVKIPQLNNIAYWCFLFLVINWSGLVRRVHNVIFKTWFWLVVRLHH